MGKSYKQNNPDSSKHAPRNNVAYGMITSRQGSKQIFGDRREKRSKDAGKIKRQDYDDAFGNEE